jgi:hypothetical protein
MGTPLACPNPMILGIEALIPHQRADTRDPSIDKMIYYRIERGGVIGINSDRGLRSF